MGIERRYFLLGSVGLCAGTLMGGAAVRQSAVAAPNRVLRNGEHFPRGFRVPAGEIWAFDTASAVTVTSAGNIVVEGTLQMGYSASLHTLRFVDINEAAFVGGGMHPLASDVGLWVMGAGRLDIEGRPRAGWNRTGRHWTWRTGDLLLRAPYRLGDYTFQRHALGEPVPSVRDPWGQVHRTEVFNLTRTVRIEGMPGRRSHIFVYSSSPQRIRFAAMSFMGPRRAAGRPLNTEPVPGRYPLHFHHCGDGSRGSLVEGCVVTDSSRAFVQHTSGGVTLRDCVAYRITDDAYWWDEDELTNDVLWEHCGSFGVQYDPNFRGAATGFLLGRGLGRKVVRDCVAVGSRGSVDSSGFHWPSFANHDPDNVWVAENLVAHNNQGDGMFVWQNDHNLHVVRNFVTYSNGEFGVEHGAYTNSYQYVGGRTWGNGRADIASFALANSIAGNPQQLWRDISCDHLLLAEHLASISPATSRVIPFENFRGRRITVNETKPTGSGGGRYVIRCAPGHDLDRSDVTVLARRSEITVVRSDGTSFRV